MPSHGLALGNEFNYIETASGVLIPLKSAEAVTFVCAEPGVGATIATLTESQDSGGTGEQALAVIDTVYKAPNVGGTWTKVTQTAASTFDLGDDTTNDSFMFTVTAAEMSDTFDYIECTVDTGVCHAYIHGLAHKRAPENLPSNIV